MTTQELDKTKIEAFAGQMLGFLNGAQLALMTSVGYRTGLIDALGRHAAGHERGDCARCQPERALRARVAGCDGRGRIVEYDPTDQTYQLPPEHAAVITRAAGPQISRSSPRSCRSWPRSRTASSTRSGTVAGCRTPASRSFQQIMAQLSGHDLRRHAVERDARARAWLDATASRRESTSRTSAAAAATPST